jgi:hypothetical protein
MKSVRDRIILLAILLTLTMLAACGGDQYADARDIMKDHADVMEAYITGLENATSAAECAATIDGYTEGMEDLIPRLKAFREKYPELAAEKSDAEIPAEVEEESRRLEGLAARMPAATMNMMKYMADPEVQAAMQRMSTAMEKMGS